MRKRSGASGMVAMRVREQDGADVAVALAHPHQRSPNSLGFGVQSGIDETEPTITKPEEIGSTLDGPVAVIRRDDDISISYLSAVFKRLDALNDEPDEKHNNEQQRSDADEEVLEELHDNLREWLLPVAKEIVACHGFGLACRIRAEPVSRTNRGSRSRDLSHFPGSIRYKAQSALAWSNNRSQFSPRIFFMRCSL